MEESVEWMTLQELRDELDRTRPAREQLADLDEVLKDGQLPALSEDARRLPARRRRALNLIQGNSAVAKTRRRIIIGYHLNQ